MDAQLIKVPTGRSVSTQHGGLIVSVIRSNATVVHCVVGRVGFPGVKRELNVGYAVLFETPDEGLFEIRLMHINYGAHDSGEFLITRLTPQRGIAAGFIEQDGSNTLFSEEEVKRIATSIAEVVEAVSARSDLTAEQLDFVVRKLDEMSEAANRLGRRDWTNLAIGMLTNVIVSATLGSDASKFLFHAMSTSLAWLFREGVKLLA